MSRRTADIAASVRQRLLNLARSRNEDFGLILTKYALERVLYRMSQSEHRQTFILKGALLFELWTEHTHRSTRDADFLARGDGDPARFEAIFREICELSLPDDGIRFDAGTVRAERIKEGAGYEGVRVTFIGTLDQAKIPVQIDIGFGDVITPNVVEETYPSLLDSPAPVLLAYPRETAMAEKFEAMLRFGLANSRMKDFYDIRTLTALSQFDLIVLTSAIARTLERRGTRLPEIITAFTPEFFEDTIKKRQWTAFVGRNRLYVEPVGLDQVIQEIRVFFEPVLAALRGKERRLIWPPSGPWVER